MRCGLAVEHLAHADIRLAPFPAARGLGCIATNDHQIASGLTVIPDKLYRSNRVGSFAGFDNSPGPVKKDRFQLTLSMPSQSSLRPAICPRAELWRINTEDVKCYAISDNSIAIQNVINRSRLGHFDGSPVRRWQCGPVP